MFASGKSSLEVAIELGLEADEAIRHQKEFWKLTQLDRLSLLYDELKGNLWPFLDLCRLSMNAGMDAPKVINFLQIANNELPRIERVIENFRFVRDNLELDKQNIRNQIFSLQRILEDYRSAIREETARINRLRQERIQREQVIHQVEQKYLEIKNTVHRVVEDVLENHRQLLGFALLSLIETLRKDPNKLPILYFNMSSGRRAEQNEFPFVNPRLNKEYIEEIPEEKILLEISAAIFESMVEELTNRAIVDMTFRSEVPSSASVHSGLEKCEEGSVTNESSEQSETDNQEN